MVSVLHVREKVVGEETFAVLCLQHEILDGLPGAKVT